MKRITTILTFCAALSILPPAVADESIVNGGEIYAYGVLRENTCRLDMDSAWQDVDLGDTARADVNIIGRMAKPVTVKLYLHDCPEIMTRSTNITPLTHTRSAQQPGYQARFIARADNSNPELISVTGASGIGLRLKDSRGQTVKLSRVSDTLLLNPGQDEMVFTLIPERTAAPFIAGPYHAVINFSLIYQ
ncbi:Fimbrial protein [Cronobacter dublinensis 1210]|uniref:Fimbrial protein n=2 Tax=Cronobacter TaxID=413496 RepID=K8AE30_9ENTR|nr:MULTISPECIES: fimbrial protein [Cronobacter]CCJ81520.1 Fimbrial protein [Cronobacter dublinensis 1210]ALB64144.1 fimbrial protein [Cronobacter condimenti 1330]ALB68235.1 fimbrial protein [Cronobacter dublinensis subsp. dublinensis LMG 23823]MDI7273090.1 fimbrial protein [Cronobacter dublinensis]CCJ74039.1 Fimbrial protein [Cronobacter condimenti 1330]